MKVNISLYGDDAQIDDKEICSSRDFAIQTITLWLRWCAIDKVELTRTSCGIANLSDLKWAGHLDDAMPSICVQFRSCVLFYIIKTLMHHFGLHIVEIV